MRIFISTFIVATGLLALGAGTAYAQDVKHNYVTGTNFAAFKTYRWIDLPNAEKPDQIVDQQIKTAIDNNLAKNVLHPRSDASREIPVRHPHALRRGWSRAQGASVLRSGRPSEERARERDRDQRAQ